MDPDIAGSSPHIHCLVLGGGLSQDGTRWISARKKYFIPVKVLGKLFRGKFLFYLKESYEAGFLSFPGTIQEFGTPSLFRKLLNDLYKKNWVVYCKPPFKSPEKVMDYLGRYTHRVAISNDRIVKIENHEVTIKYRDSEDGDRVKYMALDVFEFIRRFLLHVLPEKFMKIRHYGILSNKNRKTKLAKCKEIHDIAINKEPEDKNWEDLLYQTTGIDPRICPDCGKGKMIKKEIIFAINGVAPP